MSRSYKKVCAEKDLDSGFRNLETKRRRLRSKKNLRNEKEFVDDKHYKDSMTLYGEPYVSKQK